MKSVKLAVVGLSCVGLLRGSPLVAQELPMKGLGRYEPYRKSLISNGWTPIKTPAATDMQMPEVSCGNQICVAEWRNRQGREVGITLWFEYDKNNRQVLYLAPQA
jgi:hypothetical protein